MCFGRIQKDNALAKIGKKKGEGAATLRTHCSHSALFIF